LQTFDKQMFLSYLLNLEMITKGEFIERIGWENLKDLFPFFYLEIKDEPLDSIIGFWEMLQIYIFNYLPYGKYFINEGRALFWSILNREIELKNVDGETALKNYFRWLKLATEREDKAREILDQIVFLSQEKTLSEYLKFVGINPQAPLRDILSSLLLLKWNIFPKELITLLCETNPYKV
jgi:hypothetical protein